MRKVIISLGIVCALVTAAPGASYDDDADGDWTTSATWGVSENYPGTPPDGADIATVDSHEVTLDTSLAAADVAQVRFEGAAGTCTLRNTSGHTIASEVQFATAAVGTIETDGGDLVVSGTVSGSGDLHKYGGDGLYVDGDGSGYTGHAEVYEGALYLRSDNVLRSITVHSGATLAVASDAATGDVAAEFNDGSELYFNDDNELFRGHMHVNGEVTISVGGNDKGSAIAPATLSGSGTINWYNKRSGSSVGIGGSSADYSAFTGNWDFVQSDKIWDIYYNGGGLGTGTVFLNMKDGDGVFRLAVDDASFAELPNDIVIGDRGGNINSDRESEHAHYAGTIVLQGDLNVTAGRGNSRDDVRCYVDGRIVGPGHTVTLGGDNGSYRANVRVYLTNPGNDFAELIFDPYQTQAYNSSHHSLGYITASGAQGDGTITIGYNASYPENRLFLAKYTGTVSAPGDWALGSTNHLTGDGTLQIEDGTYSLTCQGNKIIPYRNHPLTISGSVVLTSGSGPATLHASIGAVYSTPTVYTFENGKLDVNGNVGLAGGRLHVSLSEETGTLTLPDVQGQVFTVVECDEDVTQPGERFGSVTFDDFDGYDLGGPVEYGYDAGGGTGTVTVEVTVRADANMSLNVDVLDLAVLANNFGKTDADWRDADFNYDGVVDVLDLASIANNFGVDASGAGGGGAPVPEPMGLGVLAVGGLLVLRRRRR